MKPTAKGYYWCWFGGGYENEDQGDMIQASSIAEAATDYAEMYHSARDCFDECKVLVRSYEHKLARVSIEVQSEPVFSCVGEELVKDEDRDTT